MSNLKFSLVTAGDARAVTVFANGEVYAAQSDSHPNFDAIVAGALADDPAVIDLFDVEKVIAREFTNLSDRVTLFNGTVFFDNDPVDEAINRQIVRFLDEGTDSWAPLVRFLENVMQNPNEHSREQLYRWLVKYDFPITDDGCIIAYKGVDKQDDKFFSVHSGTAIVDGVEFNGQIPNAVGSTITMPRSDVQHDPSRGCHTGLHAGTWSYASGFGRGGVLTVRINPRDVVSVPTDCYSQKVRVCRYVVEGVTETEFTSVRWAEESEDVDGEDICSRCDQSFDDCCDPEFCDGDGNYQWVDDGDDEPDDSYVPRHR